MLGLGLGRELGLKGREGLQKPFPRREHPVHPHYQALCVLSDLFRFTGGQSPSGAENVTRIQASNQGGPWGEDDGTGEVGAGSLEAEKLGDGGGYLGRSIPALATKASDRGKQKSRGVDDERHGGRELGGFERDSDRDGDRDKNRVKVRDGRHRERDKDREEGEDRGIDGGGDHRQREKHPESVRRRRHLEGRDNREGSTTYRRRQTNEPRYAKRRGRDRDDSERRGRSRRRLGVDDGNNRARATSRNARNNRDSSRNAGNYRDSSRNGRNVRDDSRHRRRDRGRDGRRDGRRDRRRDGRRDRGYLNRDIRDKDTNKGHNAERNRHRDKGSSKGLGDDGSSKYTYTYDSETESGSLNVSPKSPEHHQQQGKPKGQQKRQQERQDQQHHDEHQEQDQDPYQDQQDHHKEQPKEQHQEQQQDQHQERTRILSTNTNTRDAGRRASQRRARSLSHRARSLSHRARRRPRARARSRSVTRSRTREKGTRGTRDTRDTRGDGRTRDKERTRDWRTRDTGTRATGTRGTGTRDSGTRDTGTRARREGKSRQEGGQGAKTEEHDHTNEKNITDYNNEEIVINNKVYVSGFPPTTREIELRTHFDPCGEIIDMFFPRKKGGDVRRYAFLEFATEQEAQNAIKTKFGSILNGHRIECSEARNRPITLPKGGPSGEIFVGGLPDTVTEMELEPAFKQFGDIADISVYRSALPGSNSYAFISFQKPNDSVNALKYWRTKTYNGRYLRLKFSTRKKRKLSRW